MRRGPAASVGSAKCAGRARRARCHGHKSTADAHLARVRRFSAALRIRIAGCSGDQTATTAKQRSRARGLASQSVSLVSLPPKQARIAQLAEEPLNLRAGQSHDKVQPGGPGDRRGQSWSSFVADRRASCWPLQRRWCGKICLSSESLTSAAFVGQACDVPSSRTTCRNWWLTRCNGSGPIGHCGSVAHALGLRGVSKMKLLASSKHEVGSSQNTAQWTVAFVQR